MLDADVNRLFVRDLSEIRQREAELQQQAHELSILLRTAETAASSLEPSALAQSVLDEIARAFDAEMGAVFLRDDEAGVLRMLSHYGHPPAFVQAFQTIPLDQSESLHARVACTGVPLLVKDLTQQSGIIPAELYDLAPHAGLLVPLVARGRTVGTIAIGYRSERQLTSGDLSLLTAIGQQVGIAIENAHLFSQAQWRARQLQTVAQLSAQISSTLDWDQLVTQIVQHASELANAPRTILLLHDPQSDEMVAAAVRGYDFSVPLSSVRFKRGEELIGIAWEAGCPLMTPRAGDDPRYIRRPGFEEIANWAVLMLPLTVGGHIIGMLGFGDEAGRIFSTAEQEMLMLLANQAAVALSNARLYDALQRYSGQLEAQVAARTADLQIALERAQEADRLKSAFLAMISHELRTPLTSIKGFASTLLQDDVEWDKATQKEFLSIH